MRFAFNPAYAPPAPTIEIRVGLPAQALRMGLLSALVDTGADATIVPIVVLRQLGAKADDHRYLRSQ